MKKDEILTLLSKYSGLVEKTGYILQDENVLLSLKYKTRTEMNKILENIKNVKIDDLCQKTGFANGLLNFTSPLVSVSINSRSNIEKLFKKTLGELNEEFSAIDKKIAEPTLITDDNYEDEDSNISTGEIFNKPMLLMLLEYVSTAFNQGSVKKSEIIYVIGYIEGILTLFSLIDLKE